MPTLLTPMPPQARHTYLAISSIIRRQLSTSLPRCSGAGRYDRSDFTNQPFTGIYEAGGPTEGPLRDAYTPPRITPSTLKLHLDAFVVGQDRAKRTLATAVYNHYQRVQELQRREEEEEERFAQEERKRAAAFHSAHPRHPVEGREHELRAGIRVPALSHSQRDFADASTGEQDEFPGQQQTTIHTGPPGSGAWTAMPDGRPAASRGQQQQQDGSSGYGQPSPLFDPSPLTIEKSNILLLGPSGVGKTLMARTLARVLEVPFSMSDCTPFTQAGYVGEDADVCVARLLAASNYDVARAERGIICLDELDKIAARRSAGGGGGGGRDVSGEGVQQALLKIIEGTTVQVVAKSERGSSQQRDSPGARGAQQGYPPTPQSPTNSPLSSGGGAQQSVPGGQKGETYNVKTDNILFVCAGAFNGLHKMVLDRVSKGSIGFGATVRAAPGTSSASAGGESGGVHETVVEGEDELFEKYLPYYSPPPPPPPPSEAHQQEQTSSTPPTKRKFNTLDLVQPQDLQSYGLIPELVGRLPISCALHSLSISALVQVLTEPRNSLLKQYEQLFSLSAIELRFTTPALHGVATTASKMGTGARALRTVMERVLGDAMFETPGSGVRHILVHEAAARAKEPVMYFSKGQQGRFHSVIAEEEEAWEARSENGVDRRAKGTAEGEPVRTFEEYREKAGAAGF